jgi:amino-acid N-acetyltransferase
VAPASAIQLSAETLIYLVDGKGITDTRNRLLRELTLSDAETLLEKNHTLNEDCHNSLVSAITACQNDVPRTHILSRHIDGALINELFTRDGCGTLVTQDRFEDTRQAQRDDLGGLLELLKPLEEDDIIVRRSREKLEMEIDHFIVVERDGMIIGCAALYPFIDDKVSELACLAVHPDYRNTGRGDALLKFVESRSHQLGIKQLFVLTTRTTHWFRERGFKSGKIDNLPVKKRELYNYQRLSKVFIKDIS